MSVPVKRVVIFLVVVFCAGLLLSGMMGSLKTDPGSLWMLGMFVVYVGIALFYKWKHEAIETERPAPPHLRWGIFLIPLSALGLMYVLQGHVPTAVVIMAPAFLVAILIGVWRWGLKR